MSMEALRWARAVRGVSPTQKLVLVLLADAANPAGECWPSIATLIADSGLSERAVQVALRGLAEADLLSASVGGGRHRTSLYRLNMGAETPQPIRGNRNGVSKTPNLTTETPQQVRKTPHHVHPNPKEPIEPIPPPSGEARAREARGTRLPPDWRPSDRDAEFARSLGLDPQAVADEFADYWRSVPGSKGRKLDWSATYRNRCREQAARRPRARPPPAPAPSKLAWMLDEMHGGPRILLDAEDCQ